MARPENKAVAGANQGATGIVPNVAANRSRSETGFRSGLVHFVRLQPLGAVCGLFLISLCLIAAASNWLTPYDPLAIDVNDKFLAPSWEHPFGTDELGRDVLSRVIAGARPSLYISLTVVLISSIVGLVVGVVSGYLGGTFDLLVQRIVDGLVALPGLIFAMAFLSIFSSGIHVLFVDIPVVWNKVPVTMIVPFTVLMLPVSIRVTRGATLAIKPSPFVESARSIGCPPARLMLVHIVPNVLAPVIVVASVQLGAVIILEASLSFLGLGLPPPDPSWGGMLQSGGRRHMESAPWLAIAPGLAILTTVMAFNLLGDALRDYLDPRR